MNVVCCYLCQHFHFNVAGRFLRHTFVTPLAFEKSKLGVSTMGGVLYTLPLADEHAILFFILFLIKWVNMPYLAAWKTTNSIWGPILMSWNQGCSTWRELPSMSRIQAERLWTFICAPSLEATLFVCHYVSQVYIWNVYYSYEVERMGFHSLPHKWYFRSWKAQAKVEYKHLYILWSLQRYYWSLGCAFVLLITSDLRENYLWFSNFCCLCKDCDW